VSVAPVTDASRADDRLAGLRRGTGLRRLFASRSGWALAGIVIGIALLGPWVAPHDPAAIVGVPSQHPSSNFPLGTDFLGRDAVSRVLWGGRSVAIIAALSTALAYLVGVVIGLFVGFRRGLVDAVLMRAVDLVITIPPILVLLLLVVSFGSSIPLLIAAIAAVSAPRIARLVRAATMEIAVRPYVEAAMVRGERTVVILAREILPSVRGVLAADAGIRFANSVLSVAGLSFIGLGLKPPAADWALMVSENRAGLSANWLVVLVPALLIALLVLAGNLIADGMLGDGGRPRRRGSGRDAP
jgi:peptide/nickel transport system permease protein